MWTISELLVLCSVTCGGVMHLYLLRGTGGISAYLLPLGRQGMTKRKKKKKKRLKNSSVFTVLVQCENCYQTSLQSSVFSTYGTEQRRQLIIKVNLFD